MQVAGKQCQLSYIPSTQTVFLKRSFALFWIFRKARSSEECLAEQNCLHPVVSGSEKRGRADRAWGTTISFKAHPQWPSTSHTPPLIGPSISQQHHRRAVPAAHSSSAGIPHSWHVCLHYTDWKTDQKEHCLRRHTLSEPASFKDHITSQQHHSRQLHL